MRNINNRQKLRVVPRDGFHPRDPIARLLPRYKPQVTQEAPLLRDRTKYTRKGRQARPQNVVHKPLLVLEGATMIPEQEPEDEEPIEAILERFLNETSRLRLRYGVHTDEGCVARYTNLVHAQQSRDHLLAQRTRAWLEPEVYT